MLFIGLLLRLVLSLLSYITQNHLPRYDTTHRELGPPTSLNKSRKSLQVILVEEIPQLTFSLPKKVSLTTVAAQHN